MHKLAPDLRIAPPRLSFGVLAGVMLIHAGVLAVILALPKTTQLVTPPAPLVVRLIEPAASQPELATLPVPSKLQPTPTSSVPPPLLAAPSTPLRPLPEAAKTAPQPQPVEPARPENTRPEPQPTPVPAPAPVPTPVAVDAPKPAPPPPPPVTPPRFDADYLDNPKPPYSRVSQRMGEAGEVKLRVLVDANGNVQQIGIHRSSGYPRLDQSALETVNQHWRFSPARQGDQPISSWVIVPIQFKAP